MQARSKYLLMALAMACVIALYWPSLRYPLFFDDDNFFNHGVLNAHLARGFALEPRWLPYFLTGWVNSFLEGSIFAQRCINVGLHLLTGLALYSLVVQVSNHVAPHRNNERAAVSAALLFLLHPLAVYAVGYIVQRSIIMATLFGLLALSNYFKGMITRQKAYFAFSVFLYLLSVFSKEHAVLIPAVAFALTPLVVPVTRQAWRQLGLLLLLFLPIAILLAIKNGHIIGQIYEPEAVQMAGSHIKGESYLWVWGMSALTQASLFFKYLLLALIPYPGWMSIDMRVPFAEHILQPKYILGLLALTVYGVTALWWLLQGGRRGLLGIALLAPLLLFSVEFSTVRIQEPFVLYRAYLWMPFLFLLIPALTFAIPDKVFWSAILIIGLVFSVALSNRLISFSSEFAIWDDAILKLPNELEPSSARAFNNRGEQSLLRGDIPAALADFNHAIQINTAYSLAYWNRALAYMKAGRHDEAMQDAKRFAKLAPQDPFVPVLMGALYEGSGQYEAAATSYDLGCKKNIMRACADLARVKARTTAQ